MQAVCNHTPNMQQKCFIMAYDNFSPMLQQARKYSISPTALKVPKALIAQLTLSSLTASEARSLFSWAGLIDNWWQPYANYI
jgi:hypothetical protein